MHSYVYKVLITNVSMFVSSEPCLAYIHMLSIVHYFILFSSKVNLILSASNSKPFFLEYVHSFTYKYICVYFCTVYINYALYVQCTHLNSYWMYHRPSLEKGDSGTINNINLSLWTQSADPNPFRGMGGVTTGH